MAKMSVQELHSEIAHALGKLSDLFVTGMKLSFIARLPGNSEADVLVSDDNEADEMIALIRRRLGPTRTSERPTVGNDRAFISLLNAAYGADQERHSCGGDFGTNKRAADAEDALIAYIDSKINERGDE